MQRKYIITTLTGTAALLSFPGNPALADDYAPITATVKVDASKVLRTMEPRRIGGTNVAMWYMPDTYDAPQVVKGVNELHARYIRIPGGSWANGVYWNGNGVRGADGNVDPSKVGPDGYPAVDYSGYAPSFLVDTKTLHPASNGWHGHVDVKKQQDWIKSIPGAEALACPNAGTGRPIDAAEWVKWSNKKMGYNVRYWEIGNELGGSWEAGTEMPLGKGPLTAEIYTKRYNDMATAMRRKDPTIKIGSCPYVEEVLRDCGANVDFVSIHTYPGSATQTEAQLLADIGPGIKNQVDPVKKWIHEYQPNREKKIEIDYSEWNMGFSLDSTTLLGGLWSSIFLGELAKNDVSFATQWDCFSNLFADEHDDYARKSEYYSLWLWNNYMGNRLIATDSSDKTVYTYASRSDHAVTVMLVNTDKNREAKVDVQLAGITPAAAGETATVGSREYYYNAQTKHIGWSTGARIEKVKTGADFEVTVSPFSITYVRIPDVKKPALSIMANQALSTKAVAIGKPELRFIMPAEMYVGDTVSGDLLALSAGSQLPYGGTLPAATLSADADVTFDHTTVRLADDVGHFTVKPTTAGVLTLTARSGDADATYQITVKPSVPRPIVFWDFANPAVTDKDVFGSSYSLSEDLTQRANRSVPRVDLPAEGAKPDAPDGTKMIFKVNRLPGAEKLDTSNIRGVIVDAKVSPDFSCDDPDACILVTMQSPANWWMKIGTIPLREVKEWKSYQLDITNEDYFKALPSASNLLFVLQASKPAKGSIYFDHIGFMVR